MGLEFKCVANDEEAIELSAQGYTLVREQSGELYVKKEDVRVRTSLLGWYGTSSEELRSKFYGTKFVVVGQPTAKIAFLIAHILCPEKLKLVECLALVLQNPQSRPWDGGDAVPLLAKLWEFEYRQLESHFPQDGKFQLAVAIWLGLLNKERLDESLAFAFAVQCARQSRRVKRDLLLPSSG